MPLNTIHKNTVLSTYFRYGVMSSRPTAFQYRFLCFAQTAIFPSPDLRKTAHGFIVEQRQGQALQLQNLPVWFDCSCTPCGCPIWFVIQPKPLTTSSFHNKTMLRCKAATCLATTNNFHRNKYVFKASISAFIDTDKSALSFTASISAGSGNSIDKMSSTDDLNFAGCAVPRNRPVSPSTKD